MIQRNFSFFYQIALNNLYAKGTSELGDMKRRIAEKDMELHMAEENLSELIEVSALYLSSISLIYHSFILSHNGNNEKLHEHTCFTLSIVQVSKSFFQMHQCIA